MKPDLKFDTLLSIEECKQRLTSVGTDVKAMWPLFAKLQRATDGFVWQGPRHSGLAGLLLLDRPALTIFLRPNQAAVHVQAYFQPSLISARIAAIIFACFFLYLLINAWPSLPPVETILIIGFATVIHPIFRLWYRPRWEQLAQVVQETLSDNITG